MVAGEDEQETDRKNRLSLDILNQTFKIKRYRQMVYNLSHEYIYK